MTVIKELRSFLEKLQQNQENGIKKMKIELKKNPKLEKQYFIRNSLQLMYTKKETLELIILELIELAKKDLEEFKKEDRIIDIFFMNYIIDLEEVENGRREKKEVE